MKNNNYQFKNGKQVPHYGLRKLTIGVASVLLSTSVYLGASALTTHADTLSSNATPAISQVDPKAPVADSSTLSNNAESQKDLSATQINNDTAAQSKGQTSNAVTDVQPTTAVNNLVGDAANQIKVTAQVHESTGNVTSGTPGETHLTLQLDAPASIIQQIKSGDYIDVKLGLPYTVNGKQYIMSYGAINANDGVIKMLYFDNSHSLVVGYIKAAGSINSYEEMVSDNGGTLHEHLNNNKQSTSLGTSNGYYQIVFTDGFAKYLQSHQIGQAADWKVNLDLSYYNDSANGVKKAQKPSSFVLYGDEAGTYTPNNDLQVGNKVMGSGLSFNVVKGQQDVTKSNETVAIDHSGSVPAHRWAKINGTYVLGVPDKNNPEATPEQGVGLSLTSQMDANGNPILTNNFDITVKKPADDQNVVNLTFVSADSLQDQLQKLIVPKVNDSQLVDPVTGSNAYLSNQYLYQKPIVHVTSTISADGNSITYHVSIKGSYGGFRANSVNGDKNDAIVTLINWMPEDVKGLLPPENIKNPTEDNNAVTYINKDNQHWFAGYPVRNKQIQNYLDSRPWHITVTNTQGTLLDQDQGYWIDRSTDEKPGSDGTASTYFYGFVNETIHYVDQYGNQMKDNQRLIPDAHATIGFESDPTTDNSFNDEKGFVNIAVPQVKGYTSYAGVQAADQTLVINNGKAETVGQPISEYGYVPAFKYPHQDVVLYVVYIPTKPVQPTQPTSVTQPTQPKGQSSEPSQPTNPTNPTAPTSPVNPTAPTNPTEPETPVQPTDNPVPKQSEQVTNPKGSEVNNSKPKELPQTGNNHGMFGLLALGFAQLMAVVGLVKRHFIG